MDIINLPVEYNTAKIDSRFRLVALASQRARELAMGAPSRIQVFNKQKGSKNIKQKEQKVTTISILEVIGEYFDYLQDDAAVEAKQRAEKMDLKRFMVDKGRSIEDISELEKDLKVYLHEKESSKRDIDIEAYFSDIDDLDTDNE